MKQTLYGAATWPKWEMVTIGVWRNKEVLVTILVSLIANIFSWVITDLQAFKWYIVAGTVGLLVGILGWSAGRLRWPVIPLLALTAATAPWTVATWSTVYETKGWFIAVSVYSAVAFGILCARICTQGGVWITSTHSAQPSSQEEPVNTVAQVDQALLERFAQDFSGSMMGVFVENLESGRFIIATQMDHFEEKVQWYRRAHNRFRDERLEDSKNEFLDAVDLFHNYTHENFDGSLGGKIKFTGGLDRSAAATTHYGEYQRKEDEMIDLARRVLNSWTSMVQLAEQLVPDYRWHA
jgi:hypothetical protein